MEDKREEAAVLSAALKARSKALDVKEKMIAKMEAFISRVDLCKPKRTDNKRSEHVAEAMCLHISIPSSNKRPYECREKIELLDDDKELALISGMIKIGLRSRIETLKGEIADLVESEPKQP